MTDDSRTAATLRHVAAVVVLLVLLWHVRAPLLVFFGAILVAAALRAVADLVSRGRGSRLSVVAVMVGAVALVAMGLWALGDPLAEQLKQLQIALPEAWEGFAAWLQHTPLGTRVYEALLQLRDTRLPWAGIAGIAARAGRLVASAVLIVLMGFYLALDVPLYRGGLLRLAPPRRRERLAEALDAAGQALKRWLLGQVVMMVVIGSTVALGLALLGDPLPLALGVIAGLLEFVPFFGPIAAGSLATLVAFSHGPTAAATVAIMFVAVQQIESHILVPLVQRWAAKLPPVIALAGVLVSGSLLGPLGVVFGTPLTVVVVVLVERLYVRPQEEAAR